MYSYNHIKMGQNLRKIEPRHDKTNKMSVCPAKTQIRLVWSVFVVRMKKAWVLSYPLSAQRRLWSDWADAQADLSLGAQSLCWFSHVAAQLWNSIIFLIGIVIYEPRHAKPWRQGLRPDMIQTSLHSHRSWVEISDIETRCIILSG